MKLQVSRHSFLAYLAAVLHLDCSGLFWQGAGKLPARVPAQDGMLHRSACLFYARRTGQRNSRDRWPPVPSFFLNKNSTWGAFADGIVVGLVMENTRP